mgnify:CR=1 FL=1
MIYTARTGTKVKLAANPKFATEHVASLYKEEMEKLSDAVHKVAIARGNSVGIYIDSELVVIHKCALDYAAR